MWVLNKNISDPYLPERASSVILKFEISKNFKFEHFSNI